jgi:CIC family chloride channel protein
MTDPRVPWRRLRVSARRLGEQFTALVAHRDWDENALLMALGALIGVAAAAGVLVFYKLIDLAYHLFVVALGARVDTVAHAIARPVITVAGLTFAWLLVRRFALPDGQNVADVQLAVAKRGGRVPFRPVVVRTIAAAATLGSGGSAGSEGPVAVLGAATGSAVGSSSGFPPRRVKILTACGAAAGIAAAFNAPFAGAFFALEEVLGSFSAGAFSPVVIASAIAAVITQSVFGASPTVDVPATEITGLLPIVLVLPVFGVLCGAVSALYTRTFFRCDELAKGMRGPSWLVPVIGGITVGGLVVATGGLLVGSGHLALPADLFGNRAWYFLIAVAFAKILATAVTLGFGGSGGVFTPTLYIGAALGGGIGALMTVAWPESGVQASTFALVGMAGLVAGAVRAPLTAMFMVYELSHAYELVPPLMVVTVIAYVTAKRLAPYGLYDGWLIRRGERLAQGADRALLERRSVRDAIDRSAVVVEASGSLQAIVSAAARARLTTLPVVDEDGRLLGVIRYEELRTLLLDRGTLASLLVAADLAGPVESVTPSHSLRDALRHMNACAIDALPVVQDEESQRYLGMLSRTALLADYERELAHDV